MKKIIRRMAWLGPFAAMGLVLGLAVGIPAAIADDERATVTVTWRLAEGSTPEPGGAAFAGGPQTLVTGEIDQCEAAVYQQDVYWAGPELDAVLADGLLTWGEDHGLLAHDATAPDKPWSFFSLVPNTELCEPVVEEPPVAVVTPEEPVVEEPTVAPPKERVYDGYEVPAGELG
jgi:hypothetical protein